MKRILVLLLCALLAVSAFAGGAGETTETAAAADSGKTVLEVYWWGAAVRNDLTQEAINLYMELNPDVQINAQFADWTGYWDKLSAMAAGGNMPDVVQMDYSYIEQYAKSGLLAPLDPYIESGIIDTEFIPDSVLQSGRVDGKCYGISIGTGTKAMFYNKTLTDSLGIEVPVNPTFDDLYEIGKKIYEETDGKVATEHSFGGLAAAQMVARDYGSKLFEELAVGDTTSAEKFYEQVERFASSGFGVDPAVVAEVNLDDANQRLVIRGITWNDFMSANQYVFMSEAAKYAGFELGICNYAHNADAEVNSWFMMPAMLFTIAESSDVKEEAAAFIDWFNNSEEANEILLGERGVPVNTEIAELILPLVSEDTAKYMRYANEIAPTSTPADPPDPAGKGEIESNFNMLAESVRYGDMTPAEAAATLAERSEQILSNPAN